MRASLRARLDRLEERLRERQDAEEGTLVRISFEARPLPTEEDEAEAPVDEDLDLDRHEPQIRRVLDAIRVPAGQVRLVYEQGGHLSDDTGELACWCGRVHPDRFAGDDASLHSRA